MSKLDFCAFFTRSIFRPLYSCALGLALPWLIPMSRRSPLMNMMVRAVEETAKGLRRDFGDVTHLQVSKKGPADFVSKADIQAERTLKECWSKPTLRLDFGVRNQGPQAIKPNDGLLTLWTAPPISYMAIPAGPFPSPLKIKAP